MNTVVTPETRWEQEEEAEEEEDCGRLFSRIKIRGTRNCHFCCVLGR
jgi:hypothetical protein